jgi:hypothetical protein
MDKKFINKKTDISINPFDWFCQFGEFEDIFKNKLDTYELKDNYVWKKYSKEPIFKFDNLTIEVINNNDFDLLNGVYSKFQLLTQIRFKNNYFHSLSFVKFNLMKIAVPYIRVGTDYYKIIHKEDRYGGISQQLKAWKKEEIKLDHNSDLIQRIDKYDDFTIIPNNIDYQQSLNGFYNLYPKFQHTPLSGTYDTSIKFMNHIFGEQIELGLKYMKLLFEFPKQIMPILVLVSTERETGKTTFLNWIQMIFGQSSVMVSPTEITRDFNSLYANKNIIMIDEAVAEKGATVEKLKSIATAKTISVNQKFVSEYSIPFYGKIILCTNKETDFMKIDDDEIRFWIRKIKPIEEKNTQIETQLFNEIPAFLDFLLNLSPIDFSKSRMVFTKDEIATDSLNSVKEESRSGLYKELEILIDDHFNNNHNLNEFTATSKDIKEKWFIHNNNFSISYIRKVLKDEMKCKILQMQRYVAFEDNSITKKTGTPFIFYRKNEVIDNEEDNEIPF